LATQDDHDLPTGPSEAARPDRRTILTGLVAASAASLGGAAAADERRSRALADAATDAALKAKIEHIVVIYAENRSFNNLFADFPGLQRPLSAVPRDAALQRDRDGRLLAQLPPVWEGMVPLEQEIEGRKYQIGLQDLPTRANAPFKLATPDGEPLPHELVTRDLVHAFYNNQLQINGGRNDGFVAWGDTGQMVMGHYGDTSKLRLWGLAH